MDDAAPSSPSRVLDFHELRFVDRADVYKRGDFAATLTRSRSGVEFRYRTEWVAAHRTAIATTLPVSEAPVLRPAGALPAYFSGLLPEGRRLGALRRAVKTSADDELSLLLAVGGDAVGDVQALPEGMTPAEAKPRLAVASFTEVRFADLLGEMGIRPERIALPGVQDKTSAAMLNLPVARASDRFILKLNPPEFAHLVENEAFFLSAARRSGLVVVDADVVRDIDNAPGLLIRRFDRVTAGGQTVALAVEDACQVFDRPPADKYVVATEEAFAALARVCGAPRVAGRTLVLQLAFAVLTGNGDAHAKNFSVVQGVDGEWRVSPAYDVPSSQPYGDTTLAMSLGGRTSGDVGSSDLIALGAHLDVPEAAVRRVLGQVTERADLWLPDLGQLPFDEARIRKLRRVIDYRRKRLSP